MKQEAVGWDLPVSGGEQATPNGDSVRRLDWEDPFDPNCGLGMSE